MKTPSSTFTSPACILFAACALAAIPLSASADIAWSDSFENRAIDDNTWVNGTPWQKTTNQTNQTSQKVFVTPGRSSFSADDQKNVWRLLDTSTTGLPYGRVNMTDATFGLPLTDHSPLHIEFDFMSASADSSYAPNFQVVLRETSSNSGTQGAVLRLDNGGRMTYMNGSTDTELLSSITRNIWYHITIDITAIDTTTDRFALKVLPFGGTEQQWPSLAFRNNITAYGGLEFAQNSPSNTGDFYLDNLVISTIPEPASLGAFTCAGVLLLCRRRK